MKNILKGYNLPKEMIDWAKGKSIKEIYSTCNRGIWLMCLLKIGNTDRRLQSLVSGRMLNTTRHLMTSESIEYIDSLISFGEGKINISELDSAFSKYKKASLFHDGIKEDEYYCSDENQQKAADIFRNYVKVSDLNL